MQRNLTYCNDNRQTIDRRSARDGLHQQLRREYDTCCRLLTCIDAGQIGPVQGSGSVGVHQSEIRHVVESRLFWNSSSVDDTWSRNKCAFLENHTSSPQTSVIYFTSNVPNISAVNGSESLSIHLFATSWLAAKQVLSHCRIIVCSKHNSVFYQ